MSRDVLRIATRGSKLALWQANHVRAELRRADASIEVELVVIKTRGDKILNVPLAKIGGKALFVKEIEQALLDGRADIAVHSMKDVPSQLAPGLVMAAISKREDERDAWVSSSGARLDDLRNGAVVGTSSMRRQSQILGRRSDLKIKMLRGNVPTRLKKLDNGEFDAVVLAAAGLKRLGFSDRITESLHPDIMLPAVGQGALGIETRDDDQGVRDLVERSLHDRDAASRVLAERAFLTRLDGGCQTPLAAHATISSGELRIRGLIGEPDGSAILRGERSGPVADGEAMATALADELLDRGGESILREHAASTQ